MKQLFYQRGKGVQVMEVPEPVCRNNGVLVAFHCSLISSGTESEALEKTVLRTVQEKPHLIRQVLDVARKEGVARTLDMVSDKLNQFVPLGYSAAGTVVEVGKDVDDIQTGAAVACAGVGYANHAEYGFIPSNLVVKVPEEVSLEEAAFVSLGAIALQGVRRASLQLGESALVVGLGLIGQLTFQLLKASGVRTVGTDLIQERIELAKSMGMNAGYISGEIDPINIVSSLTNGKGVDAIIICAKSANEALITSTLPLAKERGRVVVVGEVPINLDREPFYAKEMDLVISRSYGPGRYDVDYEEGGKDYPYGYVRWTEKRNMLEFLALIAEKKIDVKSLISNTYTLDEAERAYEDLQQNSRTTLAALLQYPTGESRQQISRKVEVAPKNLTGEKVSVAVVGTGDITRNAHLPNLKKISDFEIYSLMSVSGVTDPSLAQKYKPSYCTTDYDELLEDPAVDAVVIASRHNLHASMVIKAIRHDKHVFVEKPLALTYDECDEISESVRRHAVKLMVGFNRRFSPLTKKAKEFLESRPGPKIVSCRVNAKKLPFDHWTNSAEEGGGMLLGEGCHFFDLFYFLLQEEPTVLSASPLGNEDVTAPYSNFIVQMQFAKGSVASLIYTTEGSSMLPKERVEIFSGGSVVLIEDFKRFSIFDRKKHTKKYRHPQKGYYEQLQGFLNYLKKGEPFAATVLDGIRATRCALKSMESIVLKKPVLYSEEQGLEIVN